MVSFLCLLFQAALAAQMNILYEWATVDYNWQSPDMRQQYIDSKQFIIENNAVTGLKEYNDVIYVTVARWLPGVPSTLNKVITVNGTAILDPFPSWEMNAIGDYSALQYIQSMEIDNTGRMWILDVGRLNIFDSDTTTIVNGAPKLVIYNLNTNVVERTFIFPTNVAPWNSSFLNDLVVDGPRGFAYITDAGGDGALVIYDFNTNTARRWKAPGTSVEPGVVITINGIQYPSLQTPADGIALTPDTNTLYYCALTANHLWVVPTNVLRDFTLTESQLNTYAKDLGLKDSQSDGMAMDLNGVLYFGLLSMNGVNQWDPKSGSLTTQKLLVQNNDTLQWVDTFAFDHHGSLLFTTNRLQLLFTGTMNFSGSEINFRIIQVVLDPPSDAYLASQGPYSPILCEGGNSSDISMTNGEMALICIACILSGALFVIIGYYIYYIVKRKGDTDNYVLQSQ